jgi:hypothetical protein
MAEDDKTGTDAGKAASGTETTSTTSTTGTSATDTGGASTDSSTSGADQLGDAGKRALEAERAARKAAEKERDAAAARLKEIDDRDKTESQKATERAEAAEKKLAETESRLLRSEVATAKKLPAGLAARLTGSTREELEKDADQLLEDLKAAGGSTTTTGDGDQGARGAAEAGDLSVDDYVARFNKTK